MNNVLLKEANEVNCEVCPYCSKMFPVEDVQFDPPKPLNVAPTCDRCGAPMDLEKLSKFADQKAEEAHNPSLASIGKAMRRSTPIDERFA
jgi:hypothetical protein